jgi:hypothetical protein
MSKSQRIATFCGQGDCGCPELWIDADADDERRVVITDDFGQRIQMSIGQLRTVVFDVKEGALDALLTTRSDPAGQGIKKDRELSTASHLPS